MADADRLRIVADENMPYAPEAFGTLGEVTTAPGRTMTSQSVAQADILAVRSVTRVGAELLGGSSVRFVGTATIGTDHIDQAWLAERGIGFASAPGCNAVSVSEYITAALLVLADRAGVRLEGKTLGVVGVGNVGSRVAAKAEALGLRVLRNDPPLERQTGDPAYVPLDALFDADFITVHVPLTREGADATHHLVDGAFLSRMRPDAVLINSSRGAVVDCPALKQALIDKQIAAAVLDVWEGEPTIDVELLERVAIATPHIAGYSFDGKVRGTTMIHAAACEHLGLTNTWDPARVLPAPPYPELALGAAGRHDEDVIREAALTIYDILADDAALRRSGALPDAERGPAFDGLRRDYPVRREFDNTRLSLTDATEALRNKCAGLGFVV